jgi:putative exosortase-associated protein (TIGR04073 family)
MKNMGIFMVLVAVCIMALAANVYASELISQDDTIQSNNVNSNNTALNKLGRGLINTGTCWAEIPASIFKVSKEKDPLVGTTLGTAEGIVNGVWRGLTGIFDAVTFAIPPYNKPLMKPEYALAGADQATKDYLN